MFEYTDEQKSIIATDCDIKINARAGTGKTSTLYGYVKSRPEDTRILYLAFNKSVQEEAEKKFSDIYHCNIHVKTTHSLAYGKIVPKYGYKLGFLNVEDVAKHLNTEDYLLCNHVLGYLVYYMSSDVIDFDKANYLSSLPTHEAIEFYNQFELTIKHDAKVIYDMMDSGKIPITHDFYVKKWHLSKPRLDYDYILMDEGQDSSDVVLDVFNSQKAIKVIVGDTHQQIYAWRNAINSLSKVSSKEFNLTNSFRFESNIAEIATKIIKWKEEILYDDSVSNFVVYGKGKVGDIKTTGVLARTNLSLISRAIYDIIKTKKIKKGFFEGGYKNYTSFTIMTLIDDIINIRQNNHKKVRNKELKKLKYAEIPQYANIVNNLDIKQAFELVSEYGINIKTYIKELENSLVKERKDADTIYSTVHKSKGMEYDNVILLDDFKSKEELKKMFFNKSQTKSNINKMINEEINLLYVAVTRSKGFIEMPNKILKNLE